MLAFRVSPEKLFFDVEFYLSSNLCLIESIIFPIYSAFTNILVFLAPYIELGL